MVYEHKCRDCGKSFKNEEELQATCQKCFDKWLKANPNVVFERKEKTVERDYDVERRLRNARNHEF